MKNLLVVFTLVFLSGRAFSQNDSIHYKMDNYGIYLDYFNINGVFYETDSIIIQVETNGNAILSQYRDVLKLDYKRSNIEGVILIGTNNLTAPTIILANPTFQSKTKKVKVFIKRGSTVIKSIEATASLINSLDGFYLSRSINFDHGNRTLYNHSDFKATYDVVSYAGLYLVKDAISLPHSANYIGQNGLIIIKDSDNKYEHLIKM